MGVSGQLHALAALLWEKSPLYPWSGGLLGLKAVNIALESK